jgi:hypothetical protein
LKLSQSSKGKKDQKSDSNEYLPLTIYENIGAQFSTVFPVSNLLKDNQEDSYASNYPRPTIFMRHAHNQLMTIEKVTVRSQPNPRSGANPVGSGLIFLFDTMEAYELTRPFSKMNKDEYNEWK